MTYEEFRNKYNGKYLDYDGEYGGQCWDLGQYYFTECLGVPDWVLGGCDLVSKMLYPPKRDCLDTFFDEVSIEEMEQGDVCIWEYGHIAIFDNWDGNRCWYFSQNPNPCQVMKLSEEGKHAFRLKRTKPYITPNVKRDITKNQVEVIATELNVRTTPSLNGEILGFASVGYYNVLDEVEADGYIWFKISDDNYIAYNPEWETLYPVENYKKLYEESLIKIKELENKINKAIEDLS